MKYISLLEYLMGRITPEALPPEWTSNVNQLLCRVNSLLDDLQLPGEVRSGFRRAEDNAKAPNPKPFSRHLTCEAVDLADTDGRICTTLRARPSLLVKHGLYLEHPDSTPTWAHLQIRPPKSGRRIFMP